ncbi:MAG: DUF3291 domain-containing protein [Sphingobacteriales bacterium]|nr:DUF3291 domain-containing protein [Sphingobacteriales bacterium]MBI3718149.1 DUF3291 domain-containing protein [Sphingobacteriales bacterium]
MKFHLAQVNIAKMLAPMDSPVMADFVANLDPINALAESSKGFVWRLKDDSNNATSIKIYDDDYLIVNMSVWEDIDSLHEYVYKSAHTEIFKRRKEWFEKMSDMHMALWYIAEGRWPSVADAVERLDHIRVHGETPYAFGFKKRFSAHEASLFVK